MGQDQPPARNLELKVRCPDGVLVEVRRRLSRAGLPIAQSLQQLDTYFHAPQGRLKLRQSITTDGARSAELIAYQRPDQAAARWSAYRRVSIPPEAALALRAALTSTLGVQTEVAKRRDIARWRQTRIHLDQVDQLGNFVELETVLCGQSDADAAAELRDATHLLGIGALTPIGGSYSDLRLLEAAVERWPAPIRSP